MLYRSLGFRRLMLQQDDRLRECPPVPDGWSHLTAPGGITAWLAVWRKQCVPSDVRADWPGATIVGRMPGSQPHGMI